MKRLRVRLYGIRTESYFNLDLVVHEVQKAGQLFVSLTTSEGDFLAIYPPSLVKSMEIVDDNDIKLKGKRR